jgi:hypothetical protein
LLENLIEDAEFAKLMQKNIQEMMVYLFEQDQNFGILCKIEEATFEPELPDDIYSSFRQMTLFFLAGYTFETARIEDEFLVFEAGFGAENVGSLVSVPLLSILQIIVDETPIMINLSNYKQNKKDEKENEGGIENSMASFLSNPENAKFFNKK